MLTDISGQTYRSRFSYSLEVCVKDIRDLWSEKNFPGSYFAAITGLASLPADMLAIAWLTYDKRSGNYLRTTP